MAGVQVGRQDSLAEPIVFLRRSTEAIRALSEFEVTRRDQSHDGILDFARPDAGGTCFTLRLPVAEEGASRSTWIDAAQVPGVDALDVLVLDDEVEVRATLRDILESAGHRVELAATAAQALTCLASKRFDMVLCDMRMPDRDGSAFADEVDHRWPELAGRVVFVTGDLLAGDAPPTARGGRRLIEKPFMPADVRRIVAEVASERHSPNAFGVGSPSSP